MDQNLFTCLFMGCILQVESFDSSEMSFWFLLILNWMTGQSISYFFSLSLPSGSGSRNFFFGLRELPSRLLSDLLCLCFGICLRGFGGSRSRAKWDRVDGSDFRFSTWLHHRIFLFISICCRIVRLWVLSSWRWLWFCSWVFCFSFSTRNFHSFSYGKVLWCTPVNVQKPISRVYSSSVLIEWWRAFIWGYNFIF